MIELKIISTKGKAAVSYEEKEVLYGDVVLLIYEMERIKKELLEKEFDITEIKEVEE